MAAKSGTGHGAADGAGCGKKMFLLRSNMPRSRRASTSRRSPFAPPFLRQIRTLPEKIERDRFPFTLPLFEGGDLALDFTHPVTLFVGENGTGKSTLLEAIAANSGFSTLGGGRQNRYGRRGRGRPRPGAALLLAAAHRRLLLPRRELLRLRRLCRAGLPRGQQ